MKKIRKVPFYSNTADDTHCVQAVFKMALEYFLPGRQFNWQALDKISHKEQGKGTWWFPAVAGLNEAGLLIRHIEQFDYGHYYNQGQAYLESFYGPEIASWFLQNSNLIQFRQLIPEFLRTAAIETRPATLADIDKLLNQGWLVGVEINVRQLQKRHGFNGHMVLIFDKNNDNYVLHNPGLPGRPSSLIASQDFYQTWAYAGAGKASLIAFKKG